MNAELTLVFLSSLADSTFPEYKVFLVLLTFPFKFLCNQSSNGGTGSGIASSILNT